MTDITLNMDGKDEIRVTVHADVDYEFTGTILAVARDRKNFQLIGAVTEEPQDSTEELPLLDGEEE